MPVCTPLDHVIAACASANVGAAGAGGVSTLAATAIRLAVVDLGPAGPG